MVAEVPAANETVATLGRALGRPIQYVPIADEQWAEAVKDRLNPHALDHLSHLWRYFRSSQIGKGAQGFHVTDAVRAVTGKSPLSLERFSETIPGHSAASRRDAPRSN